MKRVILLANMGAPLSEKEMKVFLKRMFNDKAIIYAPKPVRWFVSEIISNIRYKSSWKKYQQIGGTPLQRSMDAMAIDLQLLLGNDYLVKSVYSYSPPFIENTISELCTDGLKDFTVISMYPQASFSTTGSLETSIHKVKNLLPGLKIHFYEDYYDNQQFVNFWVEQINKSISKNKLENPYLLFSSHAIPQSFIKRGDKYAEKMEISARLVANALHLPYSLGYQSKIGPTPWTKPYTVDVLKEISIDKNYDVVVVPLSFINENLETRYDLDTELIPFGKNDLNISNICRVEIPVSDRILVEMFNNFILKK